MGSTEVLKIINKQTLIEDKLKNKFAANSVLYDDKGAIIPEATKTLVVNSRGWNQNHGNYLKFWNKVEVKRNKARAYYEQNKDNINLRRIINTGFAEPNDLYDFIDQMRIDITAAIMFEADYSPLLAKFFSDNEFDKTMTLDQFYDYGAHFKEIEGQGDPLPLIEPNTGASDTVTFKIFGVAFVRTLKSLLYDKLFDIQKVNRAIARAFAFSRNERVIDPLVNFGAYPAGQQFGPATDADATMDQLRYRTIKGGLEKMACLTMPQTDDPKKKLDITGGVYLVMNSCDIMAYEPVIRGLLNSAATPEITASLSSWIRGIISYNGDTIHVGKETFTLDGCPQGKAYLIAPGWALLMIKRAMSIETSGGSALNLSQNETAWWYSETQYLADALLAVMELTLPDAP
jgi:hypothetical protein